MITEIQKNMRNNDPLGMAIVRPINKLMLKGTKPMRIALIGGPETGKTTFLVALHALHKGLDASHLIVDKETLHKMKLLGCSMQAGFTIGNYYNGDLKELLDNYEKRLKSDPIIELPRSEEALDFESEIHFKLWEYDIDAHISGDRSRTTSLNILQGMQIDREINNVDVRFAESGKEVTVEQLRMLFED
jgi:hypothetical protein